MDRKINVAIVGVGGIGRGHFISASELEETNLAAICDIRGEKAIDTVREISPELEIPRDIAVYTNYYEMLENEKLDAVVISAPDSLHCEYAIAAFKAGLDVLCEKPLTMTNEEAVGMIKAAKKYGRRLFAGQVCRFSPGFQKAKELIDDGIAGDIFCIESQYVHNCHADLPEDDWRKNPPRHATSCGGCHAIDLVRYLAGDPVEVFAYGNTMNRKDWSVEDCSETVMRFKNGGIGRVLTTLGNTTEYSMSTIVYGTKATIFANNVSDVVEVHTLTPDGVKKTSHKVGVHSHNTTGELRDMYAAIIRGEKVRHEGLEGAKTVFVCNAAIKSMETGERQEIDYTALEN